MAYSSFLVHARGARLDQLAKRITAALQTNDGAPLTRVSPTRAVLGSTVAAALARTQPQRRLDDVLVDLGAERVESLPPDAVANVLSWREPTELAGDRAPTGRTLVEDGYDWHLSASRLVEAWQVVGGPGNIDWSGITVGQVDTGYTEHPCLGWRNGQSDWVNTSQDRNFFYREINSDPETDRWANRDPYSAEDPVTGAHGGHGTRTGSVLSGFDTSATGRKTGRGLPAALGYFGAAPKVPYVPVRISNSVWINDTTDGLGAALQHLVVEVGCRVITISLGAALPAYLPKQARDMIDRAYAQGIIVCCAAGNVIDAVVTPARAPRTISVAGSTPNDRPWTGSSFGAAVDISAPAWPIWRASTTQYGRFEYGYGDGTSFAAPQVAGTAALWLAKHRTVLDDKYPERWMRVTAFLKLLKETARIPTAGWDTRNYGTGLLDAFAVLDAALPEAGDLVPDTQRHHED